MLIAATVLSILAISIDGTAGEVLGVVAILLYASLILMLSVRLSQLVAQTRKRTIQETRKDSTPASASQPEDDDRSAVRMTTAIGMLEAAGLRLSDQLVDSPDLPVAADGPLVTVVVPCFNEETFVAEALHSVLAQSFTDWECVVVDDASTDRSLHEIWRATRQDPRFRVLRHRVNGGLAAARNTGLRSARGRYITFLDADDLLMAESLMDRVIALANRANEPQVIGSYCGVRVMPQEVELDDLPRRMKFESGRVVDFISADAECPFNAHAPLLLVERLRALGGFDESMRFGAEDWDLWYRALRNGYLFVPSKYTTAVYRQKRRSMVRSMPDGHVAEADRLIMAAHRVVEPGVIVAPTETPLTQPLSHYQALLRRSDRAIRFAAMALVAGDEAAATRALGVLSEVPLELVERHLATTSLTNRGMMRALAVSGRELHSLDQLSRPVLERLQSLILEVASGYRSEQVAIPDPAVVDAMLIPQQAGQLEAMLELAHQNGFGTERLALLDVEREGGRQGVELHLATDIKSCSLNEWALRGGICNAVYVGSVRTAVVDVAARVLAARGARVVEVPQHLADLMALSEAARKTPIEFDPGLSLVGSQLEGAQGDPAGWWIAEEYPETVVDAVELSAFKDRFAGERVVVIGNGPSLNDLDLTRLKSEYTIAVNGIFYAAEQMGFDPTFYVVEDTAVMRDNVEAIKAYQAGHKFFPSIYRPMVGEAPNVTYFMMNRGFYEPSSPDFCIPRFSTEPGQCIFSGQSVTLINLQLAYHMGFKEVILVGMDFSYSVPADAVVEGDVITSMSDDPNHFHPDYFGPGKVWKDPKLERVLANYALAKQVYEADGRRIVNATAGGKLDLFDRVPYSTLFG